MAAHSRWRWGARHTGVPGGLPRAAPRIRQTPPHPCPSHPADKGVEGTTKVALMDMDQEAREEGCLTMKLLDGKSGQPHSQDSRAPRRGSP